MPWMSWRLSVGIVWIAILDMFVSFKCLCDLTTLFNVFKTRLSNTNALRYLMALRFSISRVILSSTSVLTGIYLYIPRINDFILSKDMTSVILVLIGSMMTHRLIASWRSNIQQFIISFGNNLVLKRPHTVIWAIGDQDSNVLWHRWTGTAYINAYFMFSNYLTNLRETFVTCLNSEIMHANFAAFLTSLWFFC